MKELKFNTNSISYLAYLVFMYILCIIVMRTAILWITIYFLIIVLFFWVLSLLYACVITITSDSIVFSYTLFKSKSFKKEDILSIKHGRRYMLIKMKDETSVVCDTFSSSLALMSDSFIDRIFREDGYLFERELKKSGIEYIDKTSR